MTSHKSKQRGQHTDERQTDERQIDERWQYFPVQLLVAGKKVIVCGSTEASLAKIRLLLKSQAHIHLYDDQFTCECIELSEKGQITLHKGIPDHKAIKQAVMGYIGYEDIDRCVLMKTAFDRANTLVCVIDNKSLSRFITPAIIDRAPVTIAIGSEGLAPIMVRQIKARIEGLVAHNTGVVARLAGYLRPMAEALPKGHVRRHFWTRMIEQEAPEILRRFNGANQLEKLQDRAKNLISRLQDQSKDNMISAAIQPVFFVSAGAGDAGMLTCDGAAVLHDADVVLHDRLVSQSVLDLCRREAIFINVGKTGFGSAMQQDKINQILVEQAKGGQKIVRLKGGDAGLFGRLDEEIAALDQHDIHFRIIAGVTTASAMAAEMGVSLTQRARNRQVSFITGYQLGGFAEHDWRQLACPDMVTAIYMGRRACAYVQGRLMMFGADPQMPVTIAQNVGTKKALYCASTLGRLSVDLGRFEQDGPVLILFNLKPHKSFEQRQIDTVWQTDKLFQHKAALSL